MFNITLAPPYYLSKIHEFFRNEFKDGEKFTANLIIQANTNFFVKENLDINEVFTSYNLQEMKLLKHYIDSLLSKEMPHNFLRALFDDDFIIIHKRNLFKSFNEKFFMRHLCIPGRRWLLVNPKGNFHFCTNLSSTMSIGNIFSGFDFQKIYRLIQKFLEISQDCCNCWAIRLCRACYFYAAKGEDFDLEQKRRVCKGIRKKLERIVTFYNEVLEDNPHAFDYLLNS